MFLIQKQLNESPWIETFFSAAFGDVSGAAFDPHMAPFSLHFGTFFGQVFEVFFKLFVKCETRENIDIYNVLATSEMLETSLFGSHWGSFFCSFLEPHIGKALGTHFHDSGSLLGSQSVPKGRGKFLRSGPSVACSRVFDITEGTFFARGDLFWPHSLPTITFSFRSFFSQFRPSLEETKTKPSPKRVSKGVRRIWGKCLVRGTCFLKCTIVLIIMLDT